jgi:hypothetical protein
MDEIRPHLSTQGSQRPDLCEEPAGGEDADVDTAPPERLLDALLTPALEDGDGRLDTAVSQR